jgi:hypothetical protein
LCAGVILPDRLDFLDGCMVQVFGRLLHEDSADRGKFGFPVAQLETLECLCRWPVVILDDLQVPVDNAATVDSCELKVFQRLGRVDPALLLEGVEGVRPVVIDEGHHDGVLVVSAGDFSCPGLDVILASLDDVGASRFGIAFPESVGRPVVYQGDVVSLGRELDGVVVLAPFLGVVVRRPGVELEQFG